MKYEQPATQHLLIALGPVEDALTTVRSISVLMPPPNGHDDTSLWNTVIDSLSATGGEIIVPAVSASYRLSGRIGLRSNVTICGVGHPLVMVSTSAKNEVLFDLTDCSRARVTGLEIWCDSSSTGRTFNLINAQECEVLNNKLKNMPAAPNGGIYIYGSTSSTKNRIVDNHITGSRGTSIGLIGGKCIYNDVLNNTIEDGVGFGIFAAGGASHNLIQNNITHRNGIELVGIAATSNYNRVIGNHAERCGDNGISITGSYCLILDNTCYRNDLSGIFLYGSHNTATGNVCIANNQASLTNPNNTAAGISIQGLFGGAGQYNIISGNTFGDDQETPTQTNGIRVLAVSTSTSLGYFAWKHGEAVAADAYRYNRLNLYKATDRGTTGGAPPAHTWGNASDGGVFWQYMTTFVTLIQTAYNRIGPNSFGRSKQRDYFIQWPELNSLFGTWSEYHLGRKSGAFDLALHSGTATPVSINFSDGLVSGIIAYDQTTDTLTLMADVSAALRVVNDVAQVNKAIARTRTKGTLNRAIGNAGHSSG